ncbi:CyaA/EF/ExoY family adenylyl cyclase toxin [Paraburkholderia adhaesiva]|uniref:CyaA/EF/ExoY family adenylyl cyclase toxin n=1 Tax=Paraburkholderia adhaesiva TaxID=2883244 RepID=UPI001F252BC1|nr:CyaA/EF/ExoY family adenylyl cyclase toxin [Paraburkholderia adhaesiva]
MQVDNITPHPTYDLSYDPARDSRATTPVPAPANGARADNTRSASGGSAGSNRRATAAGQPARSSQALSTPGLDVGPTPISTIFGANTASLPDENCSLQQREQLVADYSDRVKTQMANVESGTEAERNIKFLNARPFTTPSGYFSGGLLAAGYSPDADIKVQFNRYTGLGHPESQTDSTERTYKAWEIAAGVLKHDEPASGGIINFESMQIDPADQAKVNDLESIGQTLQSRWEQDVAAPMRDVSEILAARSGKADAYSTQATLQSLRSDETAFKQLSPEGQQAVDQTLDHDGQIIVPNVYGYPIAGHAFVPYTPYDGNYENRPNQGLMIDLNRGTVSEIKGDDDFAKWAKNNYDSVRQSFNASDRQGGLDAHWPKADDVLDNLIAGNDTTYPGYKNAFSDQSIPARELFNYTRARSSEYQLKYGDLKSDSGIASQYKAVNAKNAKWADQTQVFGADEQNWKSAKEIWGNTFGYLPLVGNVGNMVFGAHDSLHGMTANDRIGGNVAAAVSTLQLMHDLASSGAEMGVGQPPSMWSPSGIPGSKWRYDPQTSEFAFQLPQQKNAGSSIGSTKPEIHWAFGKHLDLPYLDAEPVPNRQAITPGAASVAERDLHIRSEHLPDPTSASYPARLEAMALKLEDDTGVVVSDLPKLQKLSYQYNTIIGIRPVDKFATGLIEEGYETKGFHVKGKSASWGPQAGLICVDQGFSKLEGADPARIGKFNAEVQKSLQNKEVVEVPLELSSSRLETLNEFGAVSAMSAPDAKGIRLFTATAPSGKQYHFEATPVKGRGEKRFTITSHGKPIDVLAPTTPGAKPLTADYDLLVVGPHISDLGPQDNLPVSDVSHQVFRRRIDSYKNSNGLNPSLQDLYNDPNTFYQKEDADIGNATERIRNLIPVINNDLMLEVEAPRAKVVHHNADSGSPATDPSANYPATFVLPFKMGKFDEISVVHNQNELKELIQEAKDYGYHFPVNPLWDDDVKNVRRTDFTTAQKKGT